MVLKISFNKPFYDSRNTFRVSQTLTYIRSLLFYGDFKPGEVLSKLRAFISGEVVLLFVLFLFFDLVSIRFGSCMATLAIVVLKGN